MDAEVTGEKSIFHDALSRLDLASSHIEISSEIVERLKHPKRTIMVSIPVRMDDGSLKVFRGYRIQYDDSLGPTKGVFLKTAAYILALERIRDAIASKGTCEFFKQTGI